jgi:hypothetical protein
LSLHQRLGSLERMLQGHEEQVRVEV